MRTALPASPLRALHAPTLAEPAPRRRARAARITFVAAATLTVLTSAVARAQTEDPARAEELIRQANDLRRQGHDERAMPLLRKAYEIARSARTAGQLGLVEMALGYWIPAENHLNEALAETRTPWVVRNRSALDNALQATQSHLADVRIEGRPAGAEVVVNGSVVGTLPLGNPVRVAEGRVTVEAHAAGRKPMSTTLTVAAHASERVRVALEPEDAPPPTARVVSPSSLASEGEGDSGARSGARSTDANRGSRAADSDDELPTWRRVLPWALLGGAVVAGGIGVWQQLSSQNSRSDFDSIPACDAGLPMRGSDSHCQGLYDDYASQKTHAYIGYGVAGVLGAAAVTLFIVNTASTPSPATTARAGQAAVAFGSGSAFLTYAGHF